MNEPSGPYGFYDGPVKELAARHLGLIMAIFFLLLVSLPGALFFFQQAKQGILRSTASMLLSIRFMVLPRGMLGTNGFAPTFMIPRVMRLFERSFLASLLVHGMCGGIRR